jgi:thiol-disulfide isomerase/thioredoxin
MKKVFLAIISFITIGNYSFAQHHPTNVVVHGKVVNGNVKYILFNRYTVDNVFVDTIYVKNGHFVYSQTINEPQWTNVTIPEVKQQGLDDFSFYMEKGIINVLLNVHSIGKSFANGTSNNNLRSEYLNKNKSLLDSIAQYTSMYLNIEDHTSADDAPQDSLMYLNDRLDKLGNLKTKVDSSFILDHSANYFVLTLLKDDLKNGMPIEIAEPIFKKIDISLKKYKLWVDLNKTVKHLKQYKIGNFVTDLNALDSNNQPINLKTFYSKNTYTLIDLWASWCIPCQQEFPYLKEVYSSYHKQGFNIYSLSIDFTKEAWINALLRLQLPWLNVNQGQGLPDFYVVSGIPFNILVDNKGVIVARDLRGENLQTTLNNLYKK